MIFALISALLLGGCGEALQPAGVQNAESPAGNAAESPAESPARRAEEIRSDTLYVKKVEGMGEDFILGMDVSSLIAEEKSGVKYFDFRGEERDLLDILASCGINTIRVRVWNDPYDAAGNSYGGGGCDIDTAVEIGKRAAAWGMRLLVDFHYSDFWADPGKQFAPKAWEGMSPEEKGEAAYVFTRDCLEKLRAEGVDVCMAQIGNETNGALAGETKWKNIRFIMAGGSRAVREVYPEALVAVHFANPEKTGSYESYAERLDHFGVDYDVFASSYYPFWHGTLDNLAEVLSAIAQKYGKKVMVVETSYANTELDTDFQPNTIPSGSEIKPYPYTLQGQANSVRDVTDTVASVGGIGVVYWEGAWISVGGASWEENFAKWERDGSGWAASYAAEYDPDDAGKYYGGSAVDNQCFFSPEGRALESLKVFALMGRGNELEIKADAVEDVFVTCSIGSEISLPNKAMAVMSDNSRQEITAHWDVTAAALAEMRRSGEGVYEVTGTAGGLAARCVVTVARVNLLVNGGFETGDTGGWSIVDRGGAQELGVERSGPNSLEGECNLHFWSPGERSVDFDVTQSLSAPESGEYRFTVSIQGGDGGETEIWAYVLVDGELAGEQELGISFYNCWESAEIGGIQVRAGQEITVGVHVMCVGKDKGAWGMIDGAALCRTAD